VTGAGMGVVFVVLFLLQITIRALGAFDRAPAPAEAAPVPAAPAAAQGGAPEIAAAIGVALALAEEEARSPAAAAPRAREGPAAGWVQAGRLRLASARQFGDRGGRSR